MLKALTPGSIVAALIAIASMLLASSPAVAQDKLRIGKSVPNSWAFAATDVGVQTGIFKQEGIELAISSFRGDAQMQTGLTAGAVDVSLGSGPGLGFRAKGVPAIGVAAMYGAPRNLAVGEPLLAFFRRIDAGKKAMLTDPSGRRAELAIERRGQRAVIEHRDTLRPGVYKLTGPDGVGACFERTSSRRTYSAACGRCCASRQEVSRERRDVRHSHVVDLGAANPARPGAGGRPLRRGLPSPPAARPR